MKKAIAALFLFALVLGASPVLGQQNYEVITVQNVEVHIVCHCHCTRGT
jgi:hypothetical protein